MTKITKVKLSDLIPDQNNGNIGTIRGRKALTESLQQNGFIEAGTLDKHGRIIGGNKRHEVAGEVGLDDEVDVIEIDGKRPVYLKATHLDLDTPEGRRAAWQLNRVHELSFEVDGLQLAADLESGLDLSDLWDGGELAEILEAAGSDYLNGTEGDTEPQINRADELQKEWQVKPGDLWQLGPHRLICGDCTDRAVVERAIAPGEAGLMFTDPPYGVSYGAKNDYLNAIAKGNSVQVPIKNDQKSEFDLLPFLCLFLEVARTTLKNGGVFYLCSPPGSTETVFRNALTASGLDIRQEIVWYKNHFVLGRQDYQWIHETLLYGWKDGAAHYYHAGVGAQSTVWEIPRPQNSDLHPTQKPVELVERAVRNSSKEGELVFDPFLGSGTTLIAAHNLNRQGRGIEISPAYCAVILQRFLDHTGIQPELTG